MEKMEDTPMGRVRTLFEKSGMSLHDLGMAMGYDADTARQSAFQFMKSGDPRVSMLQRFAKAMNVPLADLTGQGHDSRILPSGEEVHLVKAPGDAWAIRSYDWSWTEGQRLMTATVFAQTLGWETKKFDAVDDAYEFVEKQIEKGKIERKPAMLTRAKICNAKVFQNGRLLWDNVTGEIQGRVLAVKNRGIPSIGNFDLRLEDGESVVMRSGGGPEGATGNVAYFTLNAIWKNT